MKRLVFLTFLFLVCASVNNLFAQGELQPIKKVNTLDGLKKPLINDDEILQNVSASFSSADLSQKLETMNDWKSLLDEVHMVKQLVSSSSINTELKQVLLNYQVELKSKTLTVLERTLSENTYFHSELNLILEEQNRLLTE